jgi:hypothetical protein
VSTKDLLINHRRAGKAVEAIRKCLPKLDAKSTLAFIVKPVNAVDGCTLVITAEDEKVLRVFDLIRQQEANGLERLLATVDVIAQEDVVGLGGEAAILEQSEQIVVLPVHIPANLDGSLQFQQHGLRDEQIARTQTEHLDLRFGEVDLLAWAGAADGKEFVDDYVDGV